MAFSAKPVCQPIQQLGMRWSLTKRTEIVRSWNQAMSEQVQPYSVDQHTREERSGIIGDAFGQFQPPTATDERSSLVIGQGCQETTRDQFARAFMIPANKNVLVEAIAVGHSWHEGWLRDRSLKLAIFAQQANEAVGWRNGE